MQHFYARVEAAPPGAERVPIVGEMFSYLLRNEPFLRAHPKMWDTTAQKIAEFKAEPLAEPIMDTLVAVEAMLARNRPPAPAPAPIVDAAPVVDAAPAPAPAPVVAPAPAPEPRFHIGDYVQLSPAGREKSMKTISFMAIRGVQSGRVTERFIWHGVRGPVYVFTVTRDLLHSVYDAEDLELAEAASQDCPAPPLPPIAPAPAEDVAQTMLEAASYDWSASSFQVGTTVRLSPEAKKRYGVPSYSEDVGIIRRIYTVYGREIAVVPSLRPMMQYNVVELEIVDPPSTPACPFPVGSYVELSETGQQKAGIAQKVLGSWHCRRTARVTDTYLSDCKSGYCIVVSYDGELCSEYDEEDLMVVDQVAHLTDYIRRLEKRIADLESART
jgi:hypothetical protein